MKKIVLLASTLFISNVYADSIGILACESNANIFIEMSRLPGAHSIDAQIIDQDSNGQKIYSNFQVRKIKSGDTPANSSSTFKGSNLELNLEAKSAKTGEYSSHLIATTEDGREINEEVSCTLY